MTEQADIYWFDLKNHVLEKPRCSFICFFIWGAPYQGGFTL